MCKRTVKLLVLLLLWSAAPAAAQIVVPNTFVNGTAANADDVNANFAALANGALNRTGGTMTGTLTANAVTPGTDATYSLGDATHRWTTLGVSGAVTFSTPLAIAGGGTNGSATPTNGGAIYGTGTAYAATAAGSSGQVLTSNGAAAPTWGAKFPSGLVMFSNTGSCPSGFTEYTAARGRYVVGLVSGGTSAGTIGTALTDLENRAAGVHSHTATSSALTFHYLEPNFTNVPLTGGGVNNLASDGTTTSTATETLTPTITVASSSGVAGTNAPAIQLIACQSS